MTPEPTSSQGIGITALFVALLGPLAGEYAAIIFAALAGALWPLSNSDTMTPKNGFALVLRLAMTAAVLTNIIAWVLETHYGISARFALTPVAFGIGVIGDGWKTIFQQTKTVLLDRLLGRFTKKEDSQ